MRPLLLLLSIIAFPAMGQIAMAQTAAFGGVRADTSAPVEIAADAFSVNQSSGVATFSGHVKIAQGAMRLGAATVRVEYAPGNTRKIRNLRASGGVTLVSGPDAAESREAVYDVDKGTVTMTGDVLLTQGGNVMAGEKMVVNLSDGSARMDGRVRTLLQPGGQ